MYIYAIVMFREQSDSTRVWCLCEDFEIAEKIVLNNENNIFSSYYNYAIIERLQVIEKDKLHIVEMPKHYWYKTEYKDGKINIEKCLTPEKYEKVCYWSVVIY